jgi:hypothetical protein
VLFSRCFSLQNGFCFKSANNTSANSESVFFLLITVSYALPVYFHDATANAESVSFLLITVSYALPVAATTNAESVFFLLITVSYALPVSFHDATANAESVSFPFILYITVGAVIYHVSINPATLTCSPMANDANCPELFNSMLFS